MYSCISEFCVKHSQSAQGRHTRVRNLRRFFGFLPRVYTSFTRGIAVVARFPYLEQICNLLV
jgi:hypothetical protein